MKIIEFLLSLIFPPNNQDVAIIFDELSVEKIYEQCHKNYKNNVGRCVFSYKDPLIKELIYQMKFRSNKRCAILCGEILAKEISEVGLSNFILVPIPIHKKRRRERGFNQCERICEEILRQNSTDANYEPKLLIRSIYRDKQSWSNKKDRAAKITGVFEFNEKIMRTQTFNTKQTILLIDDVVTTGSTTLEARKVLFQAGFRDVRIFAVAH